MLWKLPICLWHRLHSLSSQYFAGPLRASASMACSMVMIFTGNAGNMPVNITSLTS